MNKVTTAWEMSCLHTKTDSIVNWHSLYLQYPAQAAPGPPPQAAMYHQQFQQPQTVVAPGLFDAGARFDGVAGQRLPVSGRS